MEDNELGRAVLIRLEVPRNFDPLLVLVLPMRTVELLALRPIAPQ